MPNTREKLIELLDSHKCPWLAGNTECPLGCNNCIADHLIANGVTVQKWIPVTERLPEKGKRVVAYKGYTFLAKIVGNQWFDVEWNCYRYGVTHWMPLPEPPKDQQHKHFPNGDCT